MKKYISLAAILLAAPAAAQAQDTAAPFQGFYAGIEGGYDNYELGADIDLADVDPSLAGTTASFDGLSANGIAGGIFAGYQFGFGGAFAAIEGFGRLSDAGMGVTVSDGTDTGFLKAEARESYGAAARLGLKVARSSGVYARVGWINTKFKTTLDDTVDVLTASETEDAIQYGAGIETMVGPQMSLRAEYVFADYGSAGLGSGVELDSSSFNAGLAFRF
jgi:outer membrane immunogenic protein